MTEEELRNLAVAAKRAGEIESIGIGLETSMRQAIRQNAEVSASRSATPRPQPG